MTDDYQQSPFDAAQQPALTPLQEVATRPGCAIIIGRHPRWADSDNRTADRAVAIARRILEPSAMM